MSSTNVCRTVWASVAHSNPETSANSVGSRSDVTIADAIKRIRACGKAPGILVGEADGQRMLDLGALFVAVGADAGLLRTSADALAAKFKTSGG